MEKNDSMKYVPKKHQIIALDFLRQHDRCALFLDMGLGKTVVALTRADELLREDKIHRVLVIAPKRVAEDTWSREAEKWDHLKYLSVSKVLGSAMERHNALGTSADIYVINRENVQWLVEVAGNRWNFDMVIIDELSSFKSTQAKRWRSLKRVIKLSKYVIGLTGTPASNGYLDLWPEMFLIDGGEALGKTLTSYRDGFFNPGARKGHIVYEWKLKKGAQQRIDAKLAPICLSMSKEDWLDLPPIIYNSIYVQMDAKEREVYNALERDNVIPLYQEAISNVDDMDSAIVGATAAALSNKLLQMSNGAVYDDKEGVFTLHRKKLDALAEIRELNADKPILCFYSYKHDLTRIMAEFPDAVKLESSDDIERWNNGQIPMLLCHPASAGHGLNLQEGGHVIVWFGVPWSLELYQQANARLHRQGQEKSVIVHHIICEDTLDERVLAALRGKNATQKELLDALKGYFEQR